jgi:hypothetical protein
MEPGGPAAVGSGVDLPVFFRGLYALSSVYARGMTILMDRRGEN